MAPFAVLYTTKESLHAKVTKILAAASLNNLEIDIASDFEYPVSTKTPAYLAKFPHGKIPALETPTGFCLSEAGAIASYVAESGPAKEQLLGRDAVERALVQMWISLADTDIFPNSIIAILGRYPEAVDDVTKQFLRAMGRVEIHLQQNNKTWLVRDDEFSLADLSIAASLYWPLKLLLDEEYREGFPKIMEWWERLMAVEVVGRAFQAPIDFCRARPTK